MDQIIFIRYLLDSKFSMLSVTEIQNISAVDKYPGQCISLLQLIPLPE